MCALLGAPGLPLKISFRAISHTYVFYQGAPAFPVNMGPVFLDCVLFSPAYLYVESTLKKGMVPAGTALCFLASLSPHMRAWKVGAYRGHALAIHL